MSQDTIVQQDTPAAPPQPPTSAPRSAATLLQTPYAQRAIQRQELISATTVPQFGWQAEIYPDVQLVNSLLNKLNVDYRVAGPKPSKLDQLLRMYKLLNQIAKTTQRVICVINSKGGAGKTPIATGLAATIQWAIKTICGIIDANENNGTTGKRLAIDREGLLLLRGAIANMDAISNLNKMSMVLGKHDQTGLIALLSDPSATNNGFTLEQFVMLATVFLGNVHSGVLDTGNGNEHPANEGSFQVADVALFAALAPKPESFEGVVSSMEAYYQLGYTEKVRSSYIVISATGKKDTKEKFYKMLQNLVTELLPEKSSSTEARDKKMEELGITLENIFLIPFSQYIQGDIYDTVVPAVDMDPRVTGIDTLIAFAELAIAIFLRDVPTREENQLFNDAINVRRKLGINSPLGSIVNPDDSSAKTDEEKKKELLDQLIALSGSADEAAVDLMMHAGPKK
jgi:hypothetical protein